MLLHSRRYEIDVSRAMWPVGEAVFMTLQLGRGGHGFP